MGGFKILSLWSQLSKLMFTVLIVFCSISMPLQDVQSISLECAPSQQSFELIPGLAYKAPDHAVQTVQGTFNLTACLSFCKHDAKCRAVNFETGLCVLFNSSAEERSDSLISPQPSASMMFAQKICFEELACSRYWVFDRVPNYKLLQRSKKIVANITSHRKCMELCLKEKSFECKSASYNRQSKKCQMRNADRYTVQNNFHKYFVPAKDGTEYLENNCIDFPGHICSFSTIRGLIRKTVDAVFKDVKTFNGCKNKCLSADFRCQSFDLGAPQNSVCRLSHSSSRSFPYTESPYEEVAESTTYEINSCYRVSMRCRSREMVAFIRSSKKFSGKVYVKSRPNSCVTDVFNSLDFKIRMPYHDPNCDVKQQGNGEFTNQIIIQHHDWHVMNEDLEVMVSCQNGLSKVSFGAKLDVNNKNAATHTYVENVAAPNISMRVTDLQGQDLSAAQVGDELLLEFQTIDQRSPYGMFVHNLSAMDGLQKEEIMLIDALGCPIDPLIMGPVKKVTNNSNVWHINFKAFKFPSTDTVLFKSSVIPCLVECGPAKCDLQGEPSQQQWSFRRKQRSSTDNRRGATEGEDDVIVRSIKITDRAVFETVTSPDIGRNSSSSCELADD